MNKSKIKGTQAETAVVNWLVSKGRKHVERRALNGVNDRGDIAGLPAVVIEVKNHKEMKLSAWLKELEVEMANDKAETGVVINYLCSLLCGEGFNRINQHLHCDSSEK